MIAVHSTQRRAWWRDAEFAEYRRGFKDESCHMLFIIVKPNEFMAIAQFSAYLCDRGVLPRPLRLCVNINGLLNSQAVRSPNLSLLSFLVYNAGLLLKRVEEKSLK